MTRSSSAQPSLRDSPVSKKVVGRSEDSEARSWAKASCRLSAASKTTRRWVNGSRSSGFTLSPARTSRVPSGRLDVGRGDDGRIDQPLAVFAGGWQRLEAQALEGALDGLLAERSEVDAGQALVNGLEQIGLDDLADGTAVAEVAGLTVGECSAQPAAAGQTGDTGDLPAVGSGRDQRRDDRDSVRPERRRVEQDRRRWVEVLKQRFQRRR